MAIAIDGESVLTFTGGAGATTTISGKTTAGSNRCAVVTVACRPGFYTSTTISVTYGGTSMTEAVASRLQTNANPDAIYAGVFYLVNPPTSASDVVVTYGVPGWSGATAAVSVSSWTGVDQSTPVGDTDSTQTSPTLTLTASSGDVIIDAFFSENLDEAATVGSDQTELVNLNGSYCVAGGSYQQGSVSPATMSWTITNQNLTYVAAVLAQASAGGPVMPVFAHYYQQQ